MLTHYLVMAHYRPDLLGKLVSALDGRSTLVHLDAKADLADFRRFAPRADWLSGRKRVNVQWGSWPMMTAIVALMQGIEQRVADDDYVVLLSGDSFPLQSPRTIDAWFAAQGGQQFVSSFPISDGSGEAFLRLQSVYLGGRRQSGWRMRAANWRGGFRRSLNASQLSGREARWGGNWVSITGKALRWFLTVYRTDAALRSYMKLVRSPEELYMATVFWNSPFRESLSPSLMYDDWSRYPPAPHPELINQSHVDLVGATSFRPTRPWGSSGVVLDAPVLFARKFDSVALMQAVEDRVWSLPL